MYELDVSRLVLVICTLSLTVTWAFKFLVISMVNIETIKINTHFFIIHLTF